MKLLKSLILMGLVLINVKCLAAGPDILFNPINPIPAQVVQNTTISGLTYKVHNSNVTSSYNITFQNLNSTAISYTTTCGTLTAGSDCTLTLTFTAPSLPPGATTNPWVQSFAILGAPKAYWFPLQSLIVAGGGTVSPVADITLEGSPGTPTPSTFTVTLTDASHTPHVYTSVPFGSSTLSPALPPGTYTADIAPSTVMQGANTYDAPADFDFHLVHSGDIASFEYTLDTSVAVDTAITAPHLSGTVHVACTGSGGSYAHDQAAGTTSFASMNLGSYNCTSANYVGDDSNTYKAAISNPVTIDATHTTITIPYSEIPPSTIATTTNLTMPNAPGGTTVSCTLHDTDNTYTQSQPAGSAPYVTAAEASDYDFSCADYTVGSDTYSMTPQTGVVIDATHTVLSAVFSKKAPPGSNYDWHPGHLTDLKNANIFAIFWGGGNTTAPIQTSTNPAPNPKLVSDIATYEGSPTTILPAAEVTGFPDYIAMGTISEPTSGVTTQLEAQHLDITNKYEAPFGNSPGGCYYQQQNAVGASGGDQVDYWYNANQHAGAEQPFYWQTSPSSSNLIPAGHYVIAGDQYVYDTDGFFKKKLKAIGRFFGIKSKAGFIQYVGKIGTPVQLDPTDVVIPETYIALPPNTSQGRPDLNNIQTITFGIATNVYTTVTFPSGHPPTSGTSLINFAENMCGSYFYTTGGYTPIVNDIATQAKTVSTSTGHTIIAGDVFYTTPNSVANDLIIDSLVNDYTLQSNLYNLAIEAQLMQAQHTTNGVNMVLLLNPDSTNIFQNCGQYYCNISWKKGLSQDTKTNLIQIPNLQQDVDNVIDRMVAKGQLSSGAATTLKALIVSSNVLTPPSGLTSAGMQNFYLLSNLLIKNFAPDIPFGYGQNIYDNANPLMSVGTPPVPGAPWETASITWLHKVNHLGYPSGTVSAAIQFEANKYAQFLKDLNYADYTANPYSAYEPNFIYYDRYEKDVIYSEIGNGYLLNGVDWDSFREYISDINTSTIINAIPTAIWQMPGASLQIQGATWPSNALGDDMVDWTFGNPSLNNDFSNVAACTTITPSPATLPCNWFGTDFTGNLNDSVYFTKNAGVKNTIDYLKLTSSAP